MAKCDTCGNNYDGSFEIKSDGRTYNFDCFECAIHKLAPICEHCGCRIMGHGVQAAERVFCSSHCARASGIQGLHTHVGPEQPHMTT